MNVNGFVLAGGQSTRMGRDKAKLPWRGQSLLDHMIRLLATAVDHVQVAGRDALPDRIPNRGPLGGIATALENSNSDANLLVAVDLPLLTTEFLKYLRLRTEESAHPIVACKLGSSFPLCLGLKKDLLPTIEQRLAAGKLSVHALIEAVDSELLSWPDPAIFKNINTPADLESSGIGSV